MKHFRRGKRYLEKAIERAPNSPELRYMRLAIQTRAPKMLRYRKDIDADKDFLRQALKKDRPDSLDLDLRRRIQELLSVADSSASAAVEDPE
jgi:hypothetical protein